jgi:hypothetical protein
VKRRVTFPPTEHTSLQPVKLESRVLGKQQKYLGCRSAGCRTFAKCFCTCEACRTWCKYRGATIVESDGRVRICYADGRLIVVMTPAVYEEVRIHWERLGLKLLSSVTPV